MRRLLRPRAIAAVVFALALVVAAVFAPHPSVVQIRDWAHTVGPAFPLVFFLVHALVTVAPFPRTVFTLSAGVLFGPLTGIGIAVGATTISAVLAFVLVRELGRDAVKSKLSHPSITRIDDALARRGWLAVASLRLIAPIPFSVINYSCGVSAVRLIPFGAATFLGVIPGTVGIVLLGDALTGSSNPALLAVSGVSIAVGLAGLMYELRSARLSPRQASNLDSTKSILNP